MSARVWAVVAHTRTSSSLVGMVRDIESCGEVSRRLSGPDVQVDTVPLDLDTSSGGVGFGEVLHVAVRDFRSHGMHGLTFCPAVARDRAELVEMGMQERDEPGTMLASAVMLD